MVAGQSFFSIWNFETLTEVTIEEDGWQKVPTKQAKRVAMLSFFYSLPNSAASGQPMNGSLRPHIRQRKRSESNARFTPAKSVKKLGMQRDWANFVNACDFV